MVFPFSCWPLLATAVWNSGTANNSKSYNLFACLDLGPEVEAIFQIIDYFRFPNVVCIDFQRLLWLQVMLAYSYVALMIVGQKFQQHFVEATFFKTFFTDGEKV